LERGLRKVVRERSLRDQLTADEYETRLSMISSVLASLKSSLMHPNQGEVADTFWYHQHDHSLVALGKKEERPSIDRALLEEFAAFYLSNEWLQIDELDWLLIDAPAQGVHNGGNGSAIYF
jgi:hypothetical protein